jgi:hypothetical protein
VGTEEDPDVARGGSFRPVTGKDEVRGESLVRSVPDVTLLGLARRAARDSEGVMTALIEQTSVEEVCESLFRRSALD